MSRDRFRPPHAAPPPATSAASAPAGRPAAPTSRAGGMSRWARGNVYRTSRLNWVAGYFTLIGAVYGVVWLLAGLATLLGWGDPRSVLDPVGWVLNGVIIGGWLLAGRLLRARRRAGGWLALGALLWTLLHAALVGQPSVATVIALLGAMAVITSWRELA